MAKGRASAIESAPEERREFGIAGAPAFDWPGAGLASAYCAGGGRRWAQRPDRRAAGDFPGHGWQMARALRSATAGWALRRAAA